MGFDATSDDEFENLPPGEVVVKLSGERKNKIKASWASALIVKAFGKSVGFHFLHSRLTSMWKPSRKMDCIDLGSGFFLIKFTLKEDHARVLKGGLGLWEVTAFPLEDRNQILGLRMLISLLLRCGSICLAYLLSIMSFQS